MRISIKLFATSVATIGLLSACAQQDSSSPDDQAEEGDVSEANVMSREVAPGIAVIFGTGGNIGVSYGEDGTLLIDDQMVETTALVDQAVSDLGADPVRFLVNTHWHFDHTGGNQHFGEAGATIFAQHNVRTRLAEGGVVGTFGEFPPAEHAALPVVTFDNGLTLHLNGHRMDVAFYGGGHTDGDSVIYWREANVVHMGDLFMNGLGWPFIDVGSGGDIDNFFESHAQVLAQIDDETIVIPGHGEVTDKAGLTAFRDMVATGVAAIEELRASGASLESVIAANPLEGISSNQGFVANDDFAAAVYQTLD